jgi:hypothetical protein
MTEMTIDGYIRQQWENGERDPDAVAQSLLKLILRSRDPASLLLPFVRGYTAAQLRSLSRALERDAGPLDQPAWMNERVSLGRGRRPALTTEPLNRRARLMAEYRWVPSKGNVRYAELTISDMEEIIGWLHDVRRGIDNSVSWLESAIAAMRKAQVSRLGELAEPELPHLPWEAGRDAMST